MPNRPDYDGFVTVNEGKAWAKQKPGALDNPTAANMLYILFHFVFTAIIILAEDLLMEKHGARVLGWRVMGSEPIMQLVSQTNIYLVR